MGICELLALDRLQILFVENDLNMRERMQRALEQGFTVECVASIAEAKNYLDTSVPDILISEVVVGPESGLDLCQYVRSVPTLRSLPIMLLTSLATVQDKVAGFAAGTDDYVVKPCDVHHLIARIRLLSRIKHLERHIAMI
jgi:DNA-binding response OmpR family regulator